MHFADRGEEVGEAAALARDVGGEGAAPLIDVSSFEQGADARDDFAAVQFEAAEHPVVA
jgi:hypothetical protein